MINKVPVMKTLERESSAKIKSTDETTTEQRENLSSDRMDENQINKSQSVRAKRAMSGTNMADFTFTKKSFQPRSLSFTERPEQPELQPTIDDMNFDSHAETVEQEST